MLIEIWFTNRSKQNIGENYYSDIIDISKAVNVPKEYYDPQSAPPADIDESLATA